MKRTLVLGALLFLVLGNTALAQSSMYGVDQTGGRLLRIDPANASATLVGPTNFPTRSIAFAPDGRLFGVDGAGQLLSINPATGNATLVGQIPIPTSAIAFAPDGRLFGIGSVGAGVGLLSIDAGTASATVIGPTVSIYSIAFAPDGRLYGLGFGIWLYSIDPATGQTTGQATISTAIAILDIAFAPDGRPFGMSVGTLSSIDPVTLGAAVVGQTAPFDTIAIAFSPLFPPSAQATAVPATSAIGLGLLAAFIMMLGYTRLRRM